MTPPDAANRQIRGDRSPLERLADQPRQFEFDAAVRLLAWAAHAPDIGDVVRFRSPAALSYPAAEVLGLVPGDAERPPRLSVNVMGLTGPAGAMPRGYSEVLVQTVRGRSRALHDFMDMLSHRFVALFAGAGAKYRPNRSAERTRLSGPGATDPAERALLSLTGYATAHMPDRLAAGPQALLHYAGFFAARPRSAARLQALASDWLGRPVEVVQFAGQWLPLPPDQRTQLYRARGAGQFDRLGVDAAIGVRAWDVQARILLRIGPLDRASFEALLPDRPLLGRLVSLVRAFLGFETGFAVNLVLAADAVPPLTLDRAASPAPRLGWNTWAAPPRRGRKRDADEPVFEAEVVEAQAAAAAAAAPASA